MFSVDWTVMKYFSIITETGASLSLSYWRSCSINPTMINHTVSLNEGKILIAWNIFKFSETILYLYKMICGNFQIMTFLFDSVDKQMTYFYQWGLVLGSVPGKPGQLLMSVHLHTPRWPYLFSRETKEQQHGYCPEDELRRRTTTWPNQPLPQLASCWLTS